MSTTSRSTGAELADAVESAGFVRIVTRAEADALAAGGILARALADRDTPFQLSIGRTIAERTARATAGEDRPDEITVVIGAADADVPTLEGRERPATLEACDLAGALGAGPDPVLALAGSVAAGVEPGAGETEWLVERARDDGALERRPGVAVPTADPVDGLAHSTRCLAPWSGDLEATREALSTVPEEPEALDDDAFRTVGSIVALDVVGADGATERAAESIGRLLRPYATPNGSFETLGGFADVLEATARADPATGVALAMGHDTRSAALEAWREHGRRAHAALAGATTGRYDGLFVLGLDGGPVETVARLAGAYRTPEPNVLAIGAGEAALLSLADRTVGPRLEALARALAESTGADVAYDAGGRAGYLRYDSEPDDAALVEEVRSHL